VSRGFKQKSEVRTACVSGWVRHSSKEDGVPSVKVECLIHPLTRVVLTSQLRRNES
jgi:hypothetical protein